MHVHVCIYSAVGFTSQEVDEISLALPSSQRKKLYEERKNELRKQQKGNEEEHLQVLKTIGDHDTVDFRQKMLHDRQSVEKQLLQEASVFISRCYGYVYP